MRRTIKVPDESNTCVGENWVFIGELSPKSHSYEIAETLLFVNATLAFGHPYFGAALNAARVLVILKSSLMVPLLQLGCGVWLLLVCDHAPGVVGKSEFPPQPA